MAPQVPLEDKEILAYKVQRVLREKQGNKGTKG
jgi:hypothetical protein